MYMKPSLCKSQFNNWNHLWNYLYETVKQIKNIYVNVQTYINCRNQLN